MSSICNKIIDIIQRKGRGYIFTPRDLISLGSRQSIDTALFRLVDRGIIRHLSRGLYGFPKKHAVLGSLLPSLDKVAIVIAKDNDSQVQLTGAKAAHLLGLTIQVPAQTVYLTNSRSKEITIGKSRLSLKHASQKIMAGAGTSTEIPW